MSQIYSNNLLSSLQYSGTTAVITIVVTFYYMMMLKFRTEPVSKMKGFRMLRMNDMNDKKGPGKSNIRFIYSQLQCATVTCNILQNAANINNIVFITPCVLRVLPKWTFPWKKKDAWPVCTRHLQGQYCHNIDWTDRRIINYIDSFAKGEKVVWLVRQRGAAYNWLNWRWGFAATCAQQLVRKNVLVARAIRHNQSAREECRLEKMSTPISLQALTAASGLISRYESSCEIFLPDILIMKSSSISSVEAEIYKSFSQRFYVAEEETKLIEIILRD